VLRSDSVPAAKVMPIMGDRHSRMSAPLAEPCALDFLPTMRFAEEAPRLVVDCFALETPPLDSVNKGKPNRLLGKKTLPRLNFNLHTWSKIFINFNLAMGQVVGKLMGR
jgi:hypothetical protein